MLRSIGRAPSAARAQALARSPHWLGTRFGNVEPTEMLRKGASYPRLLLDLLKRPKSVSPSRVLPSVRTNLHALADTVPQIVWFGHSSYLISFNGYRVLVDPVLFGTSSPVPFIGKPFAVSAPFLPADIPEVDLLILTHDHYDHLDYVTLTALQKQVRRIVCPLGVSSHLTFWGFDTAIISELDWHDTIEISQNLSLTAVPARHFSGRALTRNLTLWTSYVLAWGSYKFFIGGDSGYDGQFKRTGDKHGPFDVAFLECGQYGTDWPYIHMFPEETARASQDLRAKQLMPVHWAKFVLSSHSWKEPVERLSVAAGLLGVNLVTPQIGAATTLASVGATGAWWRDIP